MAYLDQTATSSFADLESKLVAWLDPISGVDQKCEILRAATSILVEQKKPYQTIAGVLVTSWLQSQNVPEDHRRDFEALAPSLLDPLLDAIEHSEGRVHGSARLWASRALRAIPRTDGSAVATIAKRSCGWLRTVSREIDPRRIGDEEFEKRRSTRFMERVGRDSSGPITVAGTELELVNHSSDTLARVVPSIIWGFPLAPVLAVFETAAAAFAVADASAAWDGLRWVCLLNELDPDETETSLRRLSDAIRQRTPEPGLHAGLPSRISALLLWLTGREEDEEVAASIDPDFYRPRSYETDYLRQPAGSVFFPLERRHARLTLSSDALHMQHRILRVGDLWLDPDLRPPATFVAEITEQARHVDVTKLTRRNARTREDIEFAQLEPALARCAPRSLASLMRRKLQRMVDCPADSRYWLAIHATDYILLTSDTEASAARTLRLSGREPDNSNEDIVSSYLLLLEIANLDARQQFERVIQAELNFVMLDFRDVIRRPDPNDIDLLVDKYRFESPIRQHLLLLLLSLRPVQLNEEAWHWIHDSTQSAESAESKVAAFEVLGSAELAPIWSKTICRRLVVEPHGRDTGKSLWDACVYRGDLRHAIRSNRVEDRAMAFDRSCA